MAKYKVYEVEASEWTSEMEVKHDYIKVLNGKVYFVSRKREPFEVVQNVPKALWAWLADCEAELIATENNKKNLKNIAKAKEQLVKDFEEELEKALEEQSKEDKP